MKRTRARLILEIDLDPIPGTFHTIDSAYDCVEAILNDRIGHYSPEVIIDSPDISVAAEAPSSVTGNHVFSVLQTNPDKNVRETSIIGIFRTLEDAMSEVPHWERPYESEGRAGSDIVRSYWSYYIRREELR